MNFVSLFTGIGGFDLAFERAGMKCVAQVERDPACLKLLSRHWPDVERIDDVRKFTAAGRDPVDLICGGFPCQDLSVAGKRAGLDGERSGLWFEFHRILSEFRPQWAVIENVPGLLSSNRGRDFAVVLRGLADIGYLSAWRVLDAQYFGVAQRRRRVFIVASLGNGRAAEILFEREGVRWNPPTRGEAREEVAFDARKGADTGEVSMTIQHGAGHPGYSVNATPLVSAPRVARQAKGAFTDPVNDNVIPINTMAATRPEGPDQNRQTFGVGDEGDPMFTLQAAHHHAIGFIPGQSAQARSLGEAEELSPTVKDDGGGSKAHVAASFGVRRLTPKECERLQGFPDGWTDGQSDSARYRQLGNAVAVPVVEWIGKRIAEVAA